MYRICKEIKISAGHFLTNVPLAHPCRHPHGHNYKIEVELQSESLDEAGMVLDFGIVSQIVKRYDHGSLNELHPFTKDQSPTAENFAAAISSLLRQEIQALARTPAGNYSQPGRKVIVTRVRVWETDSSWAEVS